MHLYFTVMIIIIYTRLFSHQLCLSSWIRHHSNHFAQIDGEGPYGTQTENIPHYWISSETYSFCWNVQNNKQHETASQWNEKGCWRHAGRELDKLFNELNRVLVLDVQKPSLFGRRTMLTYLGLEPTGKLAMSVGRISMADVSPWRRFSPWFPLFPCVNRAQLPPDFNQSCDHIICKLLLQLFFIYYVLPYCSEFIERFIYLDQVSSQ